MLDGLGPGFHPDSTSPRSILNGPPTDGLEYVTAKSPTEVPGISGESVRVCLYLLGVALVCVPARG